MARRLYSTQIVAIYSLGAGDTFVDLFPPDAYNWVIRDIEAHFYQGLGVSEVKVQVQNASNEFPVCWGAVQVFSDFGLEQFFSFQGRIFVPNGMQLQVFNAGSNAIDCVISGYALLD